MAKQPSLRKSPSTPSSSPLALCGCLLRLGGHAKLKVTAISKDGTELPAYVDGEPEKTELAIPLDDNNNYVADIWEKEMQVFSQNLSAPSDESPLPKG
jgi:hypothetical protein